MPSKILSASLSGLEALIVEVEADVGGGDFGQIAIVGLPDAAVSEAKERVRSALKNCGREFPRRKITVNLAPANIRKQGSAYDLPIAISILALKCRFTFNFHDCLIAGELGLNGSVRGFNGAIVLAMAAKENNIKSLFLPRENAVEASLIAGVAIYPVENLTEILNHLEGKAKIKAMSAPLSSPKINSETAYEIDYIKGQETAKRALMIALSGKHNILLTGPPGSGKTMLAKAARELLPSLSEEEVLEITKIYSVAGELNKKPLINEHPFRAPHHSASAASLLGGGTHPRPGEITLAHRGILFLDELPEFPKYVLDSLRQPLEDGEVNICRAASRFRFPAKFMLIAAMNPCPCGYLGDPVKPCVCGEKQIDNYKRRISGPLLDRIDMQVEMPRPDWNIQTEDKKNGEKIKHTINTIRKIQAERYKLSAGEQEFLGNLRHSLSDDALSLINRAAERLSLSGRSYSRTLRVARTIADLGSREKISAEDIAEALRYRPRVGKKLE